MQLLDFNPLKMKQKANRDLRQIRNTVETKKQLQGKASKWAN